MKRLNRNNFVTVEIGTYYFKLAEEIVSMDPLRYKSVSEVLEDAVRSMREKYRVRYGK